ncbi:hypothetical protein BD410DRAFT_897353 [Rickenella mellea]|uniref:Outer spore wall protein RRT8 n=1 Tax=Rickenella mellea TaxID=50990 RepID=A0A4Y7Q8H5_9AGAM|nr:hypothetical protein BD410DRAFT_897353 [Rickenella mellea]
MSSTKVDTVRDTVRTHAVRSAAVGKDAVMSKSYLYPPMGIMYFVSHASIWPPLIHRIIPMTLLSIGVIIPMFIFTYFPQAAILTLMNGPLGPINAIALVLSESTFVIVLLAKAFILQGALVDVFDATLVHEGQTSLVAKGRELKSGSNKEGVKKLGTMLTKPLQKFSPEQLLEYVIMLPLNLIPVVGTAVFLILQGRKSGPSYHARYFQLKEFSHEQREHFVKEHHGAYIAFGTMTMVLNLVPLASLVFLFTSTVGAALWAVEIEKDASHPGQVVGSELTGPSQDQDGHDSSPSGGVKKEL